MLLDGAAAQYGTDAIAGVVNIILKKKSSGGTLSATAGDYYNRGGRSPGDGGDNYDVSSNMGLPLFDNGFVNFTVEKPSQQLHPVWRRATRATSMPRASRWRSSTVTSVDANGVASLSAWQRHSQQLPARR